MLGLLVLFSVILIVGIVILCFLIRNKKYKKFLTNNSISLKLLSDINGKYKFYNTTSNFDESYTYDNEIFYDSISCEDYFIYQLQFKKYDIEKEIRLIKSNKEKFVLYCREILDTCKLGEYTNSNSKLNKKLLLKIEEKLFNKKKLIPVVNFNIKVALYCSRLNGSVYREKYRNFSSEEILVLIKRLKDKNGYFYNDRSIWEALSRVERGKVSNKMRFAIYERDGYRCQICGASDLFNFLEIDHIKPIAKGGKSTYDNLQTLCRKCNKNKGDTYKRD